VIVDLQKFIAHERGLWTELEKLLDRLEAEPNWRMTLSEVRRFHEVYERTAAGLAKITTFCAEPETRRYLENLVARAYGEIHETRDRQRRIYPLKWFFRTWPRTFRRHIRAFALAVAITLAGALFGGLAIAFDPDSKTVLMPFSHLLQDPAKRVAEEEHATEDRLEGRKTSFSAELMTHNTNVSIFTLALGMTWGIGTMIMLFYNGIMIGAIAVDYVHAGELKFLLGWLMPHGVIEIPAILIAGQAGLVLARALIGHASRVPLRARLRGISGDLTTLIFGVGLMLIWAGFVEAFLSQYHEPVIPYEAKIAFGFIELFLLVLFLGSQRAGGGSGGGRMKTSTLLIRTPEGIVFSQSLAGPVARLFAWFIDQMCIQAVMTSVGIVLSLLALISFNFAIAFYVIGYFIVGIGYGIFFEWRWRGQTIGKKLLRLRVVDVEGMRLQFSQIVVRNLLRVVDELPAFYFVGGVTCWFNSKCQRLGDIAANTVVIRSPRVTEPDLDQLLAGKYNSLRLFPHLAARLRQQVSPGEANIALQALLRREEFEPVARVELFGELAAHFRALVEFPAEATDGVADEQFLRNVVDVIYRTREERKIASVAIAN
jgi:uncharacterized membrane protein SpoIIM required for sporulation/uncharacterized RDD family membrane protein YckC